MEQLNLLRPQKRKPVSRRHNNHHSNNTHSNNTNNNNHHHRNNNNNNNNSNSHTRKSQSPAIEDISQFPLAVTYGSLDYQIPGLCPKPPHTHTFNELPTFKERPAAIWKRSTPLASTFLETLYGTDTSRDVNDQSDPALQIVKSKRSSAKVFKLGSIEIDIYKKNCGLSSTSSTSTAVSSSASPAPNTKLINKFLQNDSLSTPNLKRNRDEIVEVSSSLKKNRRMAELANGDTTMELSFEGKAMDKSDLVKLVDSSGIIQDESHLPDYDSTNHHANFDTRNLLQNTEFGYKK